LLRVVEDDDGGLEKARQQPAVTQARILQPFACVHDARLRRLPFESNAMRSLSNARLKLLIVDDDPNTLALLRDALEVRGARVRASATANYARRTLVAWRPDVVISDLGMPREDGYEMIRRVRGLPPEKGGSTPAIACTGYARVQDRERAMDAGFDAVVAKPVDVDLLVETIAHVAGVRGFASGNPPVPPAADTGV
jgi:CheY-like chemotaxis protein